MRRITRGCTSESHPLYGIFMALLSSCVFEWDQDDFGNLMAAKKEELVRAGVSNPSDATVKKAVFKEELAHHCRRKTHGTSDTTDLIEALLLAVSPTIDSLGVKCSVMPWRKFGWNRSIMWFLCRIPQAYYYILSLGI